MDETLAFVAARRQVTSERILQALDDGRLAAAVLTHNQGKGRMKVDSLFVASVHTEAADAPNQ